MIDNRKPGVMKDVGPSQFDMDALIGYILLIGVLISLALVASAVAWKGFETRALAFDYRITGKNLLELLAYEIGLAVHGALRPRLLLSLGIAMLLLTPYIRVLASMAYFLAALRNWKYTVITAVVLVILTFSLF